MAFLVWGWLLFRLFNLPHDPHGESLVSTFPFSIISIAVFPPMVVFLGLKTALGLLQLRPWSRKSALLWAAFSLSLCLFLLARYPYEILVIDNEHFVGEFASFKQLIAQSLLIFLVPNSIWWLFLFTRKSVKAQYESPAATAPPHSV